MVQVVQKKLETITSCFHGNAFSAIPNNARIQSITCIVDFETLTDLVFTRIDIGRFTVSNLSSVSYTNIQTIGLADYQKLSRRTITTDITSNMLNTITLSQMKQGLLGIKLRAGHKNTWFTGNNETRIYEFQLIIKYLPPI